MMPVLPGDTRYNNKKLHIGNDYVTIVYNDSSEEYKSGTISVSNVVTFLSYVFTNFITILLFEYTFIFR